LSLGFSYFSFSLFHLLWSKFSFFSEKLLTSQGCIQENRSRVIKKFRASSVVVTLKSDEVLVTLISLMKKRRVMGLDKVISGCSCKKSRDKAIANMVDRR
jgi:hypothetical protein